MLKFSFFILTLTVVLTWTTGQTNINDSSSGNVSLIYSNTLNYLNSTTNSSNENGNQGSSSGLQNLFNNISNWSGGFNGSIAFQISPRAVTATQYSVGAFAKVNWFTAQRICNYYGLTLATAATAAESKKLRNLIRSEDYFSSSEPVWIGATKTPDNGQAWSWYGTGNPALVTDWAPKQPDGRTDYCVQARKDGWDDKDCKTQSYFVCQTRAC
ncbi:lithostathine-like [Teleopsis dalmanni]|uniref:lithostathine-like n=1 Tax=Teleopsis dalmanni TaxID=139649 RepID=UPI0018CC7CA8|nr:lithostathine-like [Teleopsis dalmanni]